MVSDLARAGCAAAGRATKGCRAPYSKPRDQRPRREPVSRVPRRSNRRPRARDTGGRRARSTRWPRHNPFSNHEAHKAQGHSLVQGAGCRGGRAGAAAGARARAGRAGAAEEEDQGHRLAAHRGRGQQGRGRGACQQRHAADHYRPDGETRGKMGGVCGAGPTAARKPSGRTTAQHPAGPSTPATERALELRAPQPARCPLPPLRRPGEHTSAAMANRDGSRSSSKGPGEGRARAPRRAAIQPQLLPLRSPLTRALPSTLPRPAPFADPVS